MMVPGFLDDGSKAFLKSWNLRSPSVAAFWSKPEIRLVDVGVGPDLGGRPLHQNALDDAFGFEQNGHRATCFLLRENSPAPGLSFIARHQKPHLESSSHQVTINQDLSP